MVVDVLLLARPLLILHDSLKWVSVGMAKIAIVDDQPCIRELLSEELILREVGRQERLRTCKKM